MPAHLALCPEQKGLNELLLNFDWIQARLNLSGIQALLGGLPLVSTAPTRPTARLHRTLSMIAHILRDHPRPTYPPVAGSDSARGTRHHLVAGWYSRSQLQFATTEPKQGRHRQSASIFPRPYQV